MLCSCAQPEKASFIIFNKKSAHLNLARASCVRLHYANLTAKLTKILGYWKLKWYNLSCKIKRVMYLRVAYFAACLHRLLQHNAHADQLSFALSEFSHQRCNVHVLAFTNCLTIRGSAPLRLNFSKVQGGYPSCKLLLYRQLMFKSTFKCFRLHKGLLSLYC